MRPANRWVWAAMGVVLVVALAVGARDDGTPRTNAERSAHLASTLRCPTCRSQSALETPTIIPQAIWLAGLVVFVAIGVVLLIDALRIAAAGNLRGATRLVGTRSAEEEVQDEIRDLQERHGREGSA